MSNTKIKASQFHGVVGHGTDGYFLMTNADGSMSWSQASTGPSVTSVAYPGDDTAADPAGGQTVVLTGTGFAASGMTVTIGGTTAPSVAHDSNTQLTITTPAKAAGDYDIVVTNSVTGASGTFVNGISYNGVPTWTTAAGSLGTFESETTISTITLQATEPDGGTITFNITNGALPTGLSLTGANIDGTTTAESSTTLYSFTIEAIDDENQSTPRNFSITVNAAFTSTDAFDIITYTGTGSTYNVGDGIEASVTVNSGTANYARGSVSHSTGKRYFEVEYISANGGANTLMVGIINTAYVESWTNAQTKMYYAGNGNKYTGGSGTSYGATYAPGDIIGVAYDGTNRTITFYKNNVSQGTAFTGLITNYPSYFAAIGTGLNSETAQFRFTSSEFTYTPPTGYSEWGSATVSANSGTVNSAVAGQPIDFQPDFLWCKRRSANASHSWANSVSGTSVILQSNETGGEASGAQITLNSNGFTFGDGNALRNASGSTYVAYAWKASDTTTSYSASSGVLASDVRANQEAGFSIVTWTADGSADGLINHGLSSAPELVIYKNRNNFTAGWEDWYVLTTVIDGSKDSLVLNSTAAKVDVGTTITLDSTYISNWQYPTSNTLVAYCFHSVDGYQKIGSFSYSAGTSVNVGFEPRFVMFKKTTGGGSWYIVDNQRVSGSNNYGLFANTNGAESTTTNYLDLTSTGFTTTYVDSGTYIYLAIA